MITINCNLRQSISRGRRGEEMGRQDEFYWATCSNCGKRTTVPFKPDGVRDVYCPECLKAKRGWTLEGYIEDDAHRHDVIELFTDPFYARSDLIIVRKVGSAIQDELSVINQLYRMEMLAIGMPTIERRLVEQWRSLLSPYVVLESVKRGELQGMNSNVIEMLQTIFPSVKHYSGGGPPGAPLRGISEESTEAPKEVVKEAEEPTKIYQRTREYYPKNKSGRNSKKIAFFVIAILAVVAIGWIISVNPMQQSTASQNNLIGNGTSVMVISSYPQGSLGNLILQKINQERVNNGLQPLSEDIRLDTSSLRHSNDMAARHFFTHDNPDGLTPSDRAALAGYPTTRYVGMWIYTGVGENIIEYPVIGEIIFLYQYQMLPGGITMQ